MKDKGVGVVGVTLDTVGSGGKQDEEAVKKGSGTSEENKGILSIPDPGFRNDERTSQWNLCFPGNILC